MSGEEEKEEEVIEDLKPLQVEITNQPKEKETKNPTSYDTLDEYRYDGIPSDEEIKEMTDAQ